MSETTSYSLPKINAQLMILNDQEEGCHLFSLGYLRRYSMTLRKSINVINVLCKQQVVFRFQIFTHSPSIVCLFPILFGQSILTLSPLDKIFSLI